MMIDMLIVTTEFSGTEAMMMVMVFGEKAGVMVMVMGGICCVCVVDEGCPRFISLISRSLSRRQWTKVTRSPPLQRRMARRRRRITKFRGREGKQPMPCSRESGTSGSPIGFRRRQSRRRLRRNSSVLGSHMIEQRDHDTGENQDNSKVETKPNRNGGSMENEGDVALVDVGHS
jgi:hypothetical protein